MTHCEQTLSGTATTGGPTGRRDHPHLQQSDGRQPYGTNHTSENRPATIGGKSNDCTLFQAMKFFFVCGRIGLIRAECRAKTHINEGPPKSAPKGKGVGCCEEEDPKTSQNVPLGTIDLGSFEVLSDHIDTVEDEDEVDEFSEETTGVMPPLQPVSWFKKVAGSYGNLAMETTETNSLRCLTVGIGSMFFLSKVSRTDMSECRARDGSEDRILRRHRL